MTLFEDVCLGIHFSYFLMNYKFCIVNGNKDQEIFMMWQWQNHYSKTLVVSLLVGGFLAGCQPSSSTSQTESSNHQAASEVKAQSIPLIQAKTVPVKLTQTVVCETDECTNYQLASIQSNVPWINAYFMDRLKKDAPLAFKPSSKPASSVAPEQVGQNQYSVRYVGQNKNLASFVFDSSTYNAGAAHGMYHEDYVILDLQNKRRVMVDQLLKQDKQQQVLAALYEANRQWLDAHQISKEKLQLSDNFYYGVHGIVFVYPLYELASYAEGMTELTLPYRDAQGLIQPQYLPE